MVLLDSDLARKVCQYGLINDLKLLCACSDADFTVLPQLKFQLKIGKPGAVRKLGSERAVAAAGALLAQAQEIELGSDAANLLLSLELPGIDTGEQVLFAALVLNELATLLTGDKRALVSLASVDELSSVWPRIRVLEDVVLGMVKTRDFYDISAKVRARPDVDVSLSLAFGRTAPAPLEGVIEGLVSYLQSLTEDTGGRYCICA